MLHPAYAERFRAALREARADLAAQHFRHLCELADLRDEIAELRDVLSLVVSVTRQQAQADVATMRRQLETALVRLERRDPAQPLH